MAFAIHPARALALADAAAGGKAYTYITRQKASYGWNKITEVIKIDNLKPIGKL